MEKHNKLADLLEELKHALRERVSTASDQELLLMKSWNEVLEAEVEEFMWAISDLRQEFFENVIRQVEYFNKIKIDWSWLNMFRIVGDETHRMRD